MSQPTLQTERLTLRPYRAEDAPRVRLLAGERAVAATTLRIPHPYEEGVAEAWIASLIERADSGRSFHYAITLTESAELIGSIGLEMRTEFERAELGYWIGVPYWDRGYASEAAREFVRFGLEDLQLNRIQAAVFANNSASERVLQKAGLTYEGRHRQSVKKWDEFLDTLAYAVIRDDWQPTTAARP